MKKSKGTILGNSKTGSIAYIEPETTLKYTRELNNLEYEEREEIIKILRKLSFQLRPLYFPIASISRFPNRYRCNSC